MDPVGSLIGSLLIGMGVMLLFGAVRNIRVFGADGIVSRALSTGSLVNPADVPKAFPDLGGTPDVPGNEKSAKSISKLQHAINTIETKDPDLSARIRARLDAVHEGSTRAELMPLAQMLAIADGKGLIAATSVIRLHVLGVTGESI